MTDNREGPTNPLVTAMLTDLYQITMTYAHWSNKRHEDDAVFELFFRKNPFNGEFTIFAGLDECLRHLNTFSFSDDDIDYLKTMPALQHCDPEFFVWLRNLDTTGVTVYAMRDGTMAFPRVPLMIIESPLAIGQLLETTFLTLVNFPSLLTTNAARMVRAARLSASDHVAPPICVEFGLRRAQGPDGGFSASKYSYVGGFAGTSNVQAGKMIPGLSVSGTHAHAFVQAFSSLKEAEQCDVVSKINENDKVSLLPKVLEYRKKLAETVDSTFARTNDGELAAFVAYAAAFPNTFLCLIDTYDTLSSGTLNFLLVALVLDDLGYKPVGVRLDSGDLAYLSKGCVETFRRIVPDRDFVAQLKIVASNDINEDVLYSLGEQGHAIDIFGIGTNLVTCQKQPALGCVYKLVEIEGQPRMKLSQEIAKVLIPQRKRAYRLYGKDGVPILDLMVSTNEPVPEAGQAIVCRHPFIDRKRARVTPSKVEPLHHKVFSDKQVVRGGNNDLAGARDRAASELEIFRQDILRASNPTPYKVSISNTLFEYFHKLWQKETPMAEYS
mmetsp:Transcript_17325/g.47302  ORF Transcript_17325/g.47302 Transcript_17325/m.47302 type:complete len:553 (+) Transcript_17325:189-1847(+)